MKNKMTKYLPVLLAALMLTACTPTTPNAPAVTEQQSGETSVPADTTAPSETTVADTVFNDRVPADISESGVIEATLNATKELFDSIQSGDAKKIAEIINSDEDAVNSWLPSTKLGGYSIEGTFKEQKTTALGQTYNAYYILVSVNVTEGGNATLRQGEHLYRVYTEGAASMVGDIYPDDAVPATTIEGDAIARLCERYIIFLGGNDFDNVDSLFADGAMNYDSLREFAYTNHDDIASMDDLTNAVKDNLGYEVTSWESLTKWEGFEPYERVPRGGSWLYYDIVERTDDKCVITYYADAVGFAKAKTVEYSISKNENGTPRLNGAKTLEDAGLNLSRGAV